jgi:hypothetical protein
MGRGGTHVAVAFSGWGPSGRRFKSCLPDVREVARLIESGNRPVRLYECAGVSHNSPGNPVLKITASTAGACGSSRPRASGCRAAAPPSKSPARTFFQLAAKDTRAQRRNTGPPRVAVVFRGVHGRQNRLDGIGAGLSC